MTVLSVPQTITLARNAGFTGDSLVNIVAIAMAESDLDTSQTNSIGATGILQILLSAHPDVSRAQALDPVFSFAYAYKLSSGGKNFCPWQSYSSTICGASGPNGWNNRWAQYLPTVRAAVGSGGGNGPPLVGPPLALNLNWLATGYLPSNAYTSVYKGPGTDTPHYAYDYQTPFHTAITSLQAGTVAIADFQPWGGQVFVKPTGGGAQFYVYHLDTITVKVGQVVAIGDTIGLSGGQNSGGVHPISTQWSSGPHTHVGLFTKFVSSQNGTIPYGPDIGPLIIALRVGNVNVGISNSGTVIGPAAYVPLLVQVHNTLINVPGFHGMALALDEAEQFPGYVNLATSAYDVTGIVRSVGATVTDNFVPLVVRGDLVMLGTAILFLLLIKVVLDVGEKAGPALMMAGAL